MAALLNSIVRQTDNFWRSPLWVIRANYDHSDRGRARRRRYDKSEKGRARTERYEATEKRKVRKYFTQRSRRTTQRLLEENGIPQYMRTNGFGSPKTISVVVRASTALPV